MERHPRRPSVARSPHRMALAAVLATSLALNVVGGGWGLPAEESWSNDDPTPKVALAIPYYWGQDWYKYPYLQPWIDHALYWPTLRAVERAGQLQTAAQDEDCFKLDPDCLEVDDRPALVGGLMRRSRHLRALMGAGLALAAYALARRLRAGTTAAVTAAAVVAVTQSAVFYAHVGNVDLPSAFWAAWALVAWAGLLHGDRPRDWLAFGALGGAALATKESVVGLFVLPAAIVVARRAWRAWAAAGTAASGSSTDVAAIDDDRSTTRVVAARIAEPSIARRTTAALRGATWPGPALAALALLVVYGTALNVLGNPEGFRQHVAYWLTGPGIDPWNDRYRGVLLLIAESGRRVVEAMGAPLALACTAGAALALGHAMIAWRGWGLLASGPAPSRADLAGTTPSTSRAADGATSQAASGATPAAARLAWLVVPVASYLLFTILPVRYTYVRFALPVVPVLAVWGGLALSAAWQRGALGRALARFAMAHGLLVSVHLDLLLLRDARYDAEAWLAANVMPDDIVRYVGSTTHLPRLELLGIEAERIEEEQFDAEQLTRMATPDVVVISSRGIEDLDDAGLAFLAETTAGRGPYRLAYDGDTRTGLEPLLLGAELESRISPRVFVLVPVEDGA